MKKKPKKYLELYRRWLIKGEIPRHGLCSCGIYGALKKSGMIPSEEETEAINCELGFSASLFWASGEKYSYDNISDEILMRKFTPLRQTIVLFLAALNNEL